jgi:peptidoglycan hydrolase CwlO-like protein
MGEESFGSAEHMNGEQLIGREKYFVDEIAKLTKERGKRADCWKKVQEKKTAATATAAAKKKKKKKKKTATAAKKKEGMAQVTMRTRVRVV